MLRILVIHGPNLNMLGRRERDIYGRETLEEINRQLVAEAEKAGIKVETYQSNDEGDFIGRIHACAGNTDLIIMNPAAFTHYSYAIRDAVLSVDIPVIEVHISNIYSREEFRRYSVIAPVALGQISGFGAFSYRLALQAGLEYLSRRKERPGQ